jgi:hypothetical protein
MNLMKGEQGLSIPREVQALPPYLCPWRAEGGPLPGVHVSVSPYSVYTLTKLSPYLYSPIILESHSVQQVPDDRHVCSAEDHETF